MRLAFTSKDGNYCPEGPRLVLDTLAAETSFEVAEGDIPPKFDVSDRLLKLSQLLLKIDFA